MEGEDIDHRFRPTLRGQLSGQSRLELPDLPGAGQEGEDIPRLLHQGLADGAGHGWQPVRSRVAVGVTDLDGMAAAGGLDEGGATQEVRQGSGVQGGGHGQEAQVGAQAGDHVQGQGQAQGGLQVLLVELVEEDGADPGQGRIDLEAPGEESLGQDLDPGAGADAPLEADLVADRLAQGLPQQVRHAGGGEARRRPSRLQQQEALAGQPVLREQGQGHAGGFAGAGGGLQEGMTGAQGGAEFVQDRVNRQVFAADGEGHVNGRGLKELPPGWPPGSARRGCRSAPDGHRPGPSGGRPGGGIPPGRWR